MPAASEYVIVNPSDDIVTIAQWFADRRILYEYPDHDPKTFGEYGPDHVTTIRRGIIAELTVFSYLHEALREQHGDKTPRDRQASVRNKLALYITLGRSDEGFDLTVAGYTVDVKVYGTQLVAYDKIPGLNLLVNRNELANQTAADLYVQAFITTDKKVVLAGYHEGLPPLNTSGRFPSQAYACPVPDLLPMANLRQLVIDG